MLRLATLALTRPSLTNRDHKELLKGKRSHADEVSRRGLQSGQGRAFDGIAFEFDSGPGFG